MVPVEQADRVLVELQRLSRPAAAQRGNRAGGAGGGDGGVIGEQAEPGQLQIQRQATSILRRRGTDASSEDTERPAGHRAAEQPLREGARAAASGREIAHRATPEVETPPGLVPPRYGALNAAASLPRLTSR